MPTDRTTTFRCHLDLPAGFRRGDLLAFHRRDPQQQAEQVDDTSLRKGLMWDGLPACLTLQIAAHAAEATLEIDGEPATDGTAALTAMVRRMLGLTQPVEQFEQCYRDHPQLGALIRHHPGLRVPLSATPFEALAWAITGQQISVGAAISVRRRFIQTAGIAHRSGLFCHPDPHRVAALDEDRLRQAGLSRGKAQTLLALSQCVIDGQLPLDDWLGAPPVDDIRAQLLQVRGIGPWTVSYGLLRGYGWLDGSLHGDVAVRRNLQRLLGRDDKPDAAETERWLAGFSPWRALVAAHLWAMQAADGY